LLTIQPKHPRDNSEEEGNYSGSFHWYVG